MAQIGEVIKIGLWNKPMECLKATLTAYLCYSEYTRYSCSHRITEATISVNLDPREKADRIVISPVVDPMPRSLPQKKQPKNSKFIL